MATRSRYRRPAQPRQANWGWLGLILLSVNLYAGQWAAAVLVATFLAAYALAFRVTRCRVETNAHTPCKWLVRGLVGTCDWHRDYKRGLPQIMPSQQNGQRPWLIWPREDLQRRPVPERQPSSGKAVVPPSWASVDTRLAALGVVIAALSLVVTALGIANQWR